MPHPARRIAAVLLPALGLGAALLSLRLAPPSYLGRCRVALEPLASEPGSAPTPAALWTGAGREAIRQALASGPAGAAPDAGVAEAFLSHLRWRATDTPSVFDLLYDSPDPLLAPRGADAASAALERLFASPPGDLAGLRARLRAVEEALRSLPAAEDSEPELLEERRRATETGAADMAEQYGRARSARLDLEARWNALRQSAGSGGSEWIDSPELEALRDERSRLEQRHDQLAVRFGPQWPEMKEVTERLASVEESLFQEAARLAGDAVRAAEGEYRQALAQERALERSLRGQRQEARDLEERAAREQERRARRADLQAERAAVSSRISRQAPPGIVAARARVLIPAGSPAPRRGWPTPARLAAGGLAGLLLGLGTLRVAERLDPTLSSAAEAERALDAPILALLPEVPGGLPPGLLRLESAPPPGVEGPIDPLAAAARGFRDLRTGLLLTRGGEPARMLLVTSCRRGEGKTAVAVHVALSLARRGGRVLLIDAQLHRPRAHRFFQAPPGPGLIDVLAGTVKLEEAVRATDEGGLFLMPAGDVNGGDSDLLDAASLRHLRDRLLQPGRFQHLVVDAGEVGSAAAPERLAVACTGILVVVRARRNTRNTARQAAATLRRHGAPLLAGVWIGPEPPPGASVQAAQHAAADAASHAAAAPGPESAAAERGPAAIHSTPSPPQPALDPEVMRRLEMLRSRLGRSRGGP